MKKNFFKAILVMALMAASLSSFGQKLISSPTAIYIDVYAYVPTPTWVGEVVEKATAAITWYDASGSCDTHTVPGSKPDVTNDLKWSFEDSLAGVNATHVTYKIIVSNGAGTIGWTAEGTHYLCNGNTIIVTDWQLKWNTLGPNNPG